VLLFYNAFQPRVIFLPKTSISFQYKNWKVLSCKEKEIEEKLLNVSGNEEKTAVIYVWINFKCLKICVLQANRAANQGENIDDDKLNRFVQRALAESRR
jgi:hypothetical protein